MPQDYGIPAPEPHGQPAPHAPARYLVVIDAGGDRVARLFLADRTQVAQFHAGAEEVAAMVSGITATRSGTDAAWNDALRGHSDAERRAAEIYELEL